MAAERIEERHDNGWQVYGGLAETCALNPPVELAQLPVSVLSAIPSTPAPFGHGLLSQVVFLRSYSRTKPATGEPETWRDVVERVMTGLWSVFRWHMSVHNLPIESWEPFFANAAKEMYLMRWTPPGRGLWMMGTDFVYQRGSTALNNCAAVSTRDGLVASAGWAMDTLMNGGGVGFDTAWNPCKCLYRSGKPDITPSSAPASAATIEERMRQQRVDRMLAEARLPPADEQSWSRVIPSYLTNPTWYSEHVHIIPDSREGWVWSVKLLLNAYLREEPEMVDEFTAFPTFDYHLIRPRGSPIRGFGGIASGADPLIKLHQRLCCFLDYFLGYAHLASNGRHLYIVEGRERMLDVRYPGLSLLPHSEEEILHRLAAIDYSDPAAIAAATTRYLDTAKQRRVERLECAKNGGSAVRLVVDVFNAIGDCVVSGNVRRSSEIAVGEPDNEAFRRLKDYTLFPERATIGFNSNNSVRFTQVSQYTRYLPLLAEQTRRNGEPGYLFQLNVSRYGRISRPPRARASAATAEGCWTREMEEDAAILSNPCGEICLESHEFCNLSEVPLNRFLSRSSAADSTDGELSFDTEGFLRCVEHATFYCKCVSILPCQSKETNAVIARNRRIGVSLSGIAIIYDLLGATKLISILKEGYRRVREFDVKLSRVLGVVPSIRVTTCKPSGTISLITGSTPGVHFPIAGRYAKRRVIIGDAIPLADVLKRIGVEHEPSIYSHDGICFTFYVDTLASLYSTSLQQSQQSQQQSERGVRAQSEVGLYEMLTLVATVQREWADNMVSTTVTFDPVTEGPRLEQAIANFAPVLKSCAFLPNDCHVYRQMPYEAITREEYIAGSSQLPADVDLPRLLAEAGRRHETPEAPLFCDSASCELSPSTLSTTSRGIILV